MSENIIVIEHATKVFKENTIFSDVSVSFEKGKIHGLIGRNGSGKTVLFKCICGFMPLTSGTIRVNGQIVGKDIDIPKGLGIIIEEPGFLPQYSGYKNLAMLASTRHVASKDTLSEVMLRVGLSPDNKKSVGKYSLGMRQRLGIAQAIMENPSILILDEPTNGLDSSGVEDVRILLSELAAAGTTILLASHSTEDVQLLCDTVYELRDGAFLARASRSNG